MFIVIALKSSSAMFNIWPPQRSFQLTTFVGRQKPYLYPLKVSDWA